VAVVVVVIVQLVEQAQVLLLVLVAQGLHLAFQEVQLLMQGAGAAVRYQLEALAVLVAAEQAAHIVLL
jgi:hypothetical protein